MKKKVLKDEWMQSYKVAPILFLLCFCFVCSCGSGSGSGSGYGSSCVVAIARFLEDGREKRIATVSEEVLLRRQVAI